MGGAGGCGGAAKQQVLGCLCYVNQERSLSRRGCTWRAHRDAGTVAEAGEAGRSQPLITDLNALRVVSDSRLQTAGQRTAGDP